MNLNLVEIPRPDANTIWISKEYGIRSTREFTRHAQRDIFGVVSDVAAINLRGLHYTFSAGYKRYNAYSNQVKFPQFADETPISTKVNSLGLAVLFHGLNGQPSLWDEHAALFENTPEIEVYAPAVPQEGHLPLESDQSHALLKRIVDWTKANPGKPVALFGQSNGSRFALQFEIWLRERAPTTPVHVCITSGVMYGTSTVDLTNYVFWTDVTETFSFSKLSLANCEELAFGSDAARKLVGEGRKPLPSGVASRDYIMYSPMHDVHVPNTGSGLPILVPEGQELKTEKHYLVTNYGHNAIVTALAEKQIGDCVSWMKRSAEKAS